ncbi:MAG: endonuclease/exonuclease/phosphatase family protein [Acidimicrobiia bacterium]
MALVARLQWTAWPAELVSNFPVQLFVIGFLLTVTAALLRAPVSAVIAALVAVLSGLTVLGTLTTDPRTARPDGDRVTLGHLNAQTRSIDTTALGRYLTATRPDVFVILDPLQDDVPLLAHDAPGYQVHLGGSHPHESADYVRTVVLSRRTVTAVTHPVGAEFGASAVSFSLEDADGPISVLVMGTDSPTTPARAHARDQALNAAARWSRRQGPRRVVMGDFNATPWSPSFRRLVHDGRLFDSLDGFGLQVSWPESNLLLRIPIDHALLGPALAATDRGTGPAFGSQHRSLHVTLGTRAGRAGGSPQSGA